MNPDAIRAQSLRDAIRELRIELVILNDRVARSVGLQPRDLDILDVIDREGPCTPSQIAGRISWSRATMTGVLSRLEADEWIERDTNPSDGRSMTIRSTARFAELTSAYAAADRVVDESEVSPEVIDFIAEATVRLRTANRST
ncbi:MarR family winged helix-turn-helix transcriptional regulator [Brevibacterium linens]|uniref:DNA-binding transcriptional regulator, MarR family n=1 Tax=Brevibacterium linens TaxID=1703 RepID=A0A2H1I6E7_BRELN|nr:MarR family transcriptional regulator [Brevibacterium linens]SMX70777.1 DNA-binding transcriptional regulator, MarR family [Brevibacterium linens]